MEATTFLYQVVNKSNLNVLGRVAETRELARQEKRTLEKQGHSNLGILQYKVSKVVR